MISERQRVRENNEDDSNDRDKSTSKTFKKKTESN